MNFAINAASRLSAKKPTIPIADHFATPTRMRRHSGFSSSSAPPCEVTPARWQTGFLGIDDAADDQTAIRTVASFVVESGRPDLNRD